jgi:dTDP-4-amino-4,6-dideoxygalactose transaminase
LDPERYAVPAGLPLLRIGANVYDPNFKVSGLPSLNATIGHKTFTRLDEYNEIRIQNATKIKKCLSYEDHIRFPGPEHNGRSVYLRLPLIFDDEEMRNQALRLLQKQRLGASCSYPMSLNRISAFSKHIINENDLSGSHFVANRILTLPTHPYVVDDDIDRITTTIQHITS